MKNDENSNQPERIYLKDYSAPKFSVEKIDLHFDLHETKTTVRAVQQIIKLEESTLELNGENLTLISVKLNDRLLQESEFEVSKDKLKIFSVPQTFILEISVEINPAANKSCVGLYLSKGIFATQCEAEGFRHITYFMDRPDVMTTYSVSIEADQKKYPVLLSNGDLIQKKELDNGRHQTLWRDPHKKPSYLFALVAGDLGLIKDEFTTKSGKNVLLEIYASHGKQERCKHALVSLKKAMKWDEDRFGLEYDLNQYMIVSIDDFNMGAMENKGLNIFNSRLVLADPKSATDTDFERIESVVGHEYFHNWTGNRVTCRNWFELSLKEGLTVFRDQEFSSDLNSRAVQRIKDVDALRTSQFSEDAGPNSHPVRPDSCLSVDNFYTSTIYEKGSEVIRMMQTIVGKKGFREGMNEFFKRHDGQAVTILDFADAIAFPNKADFSQFKLWYSQSGTPEVHVKEFWSASEKTYILTLTQSCKPSIKQAKKEPFHIPLLIGLLDSKGHEMLLESDDISLNSDENAVVHLKKATQEFKFKNIYEKPVLSLNREFSAPIKLIWNASSAEILHLIKYDQDWFNRRESVFKMTLQEMRRLIAEHQSGRESLVSEDVINALGFILNDSKIDSQFKALMLTLPDSDNLAQEEDLLDGQTFYTARLKLIRSFTSKFSDEILKLYNSQNVSDSIGARALKNVLLRYKIEAGDSEWTEIAYTQYSNAKNMTDSIAALGALAETESEQKNIALDDFFRKWSSDAVVFNKWLYVQATPNKIDTFTTVKMLSEKPPFSLENPNNVYSLVGVFGENYFAMQAKAPDSFKWLCDVILKLDQMNPQVAARICSTFNFVKKYPEPIRHCALNEIKRVLAFEGLSKNSRELLETLI
jgi:aminopeptidase N